MHRADHAVAQHEQQHREEDAQGDTGHEAEQHRGTENAQHDGEIQWREVADILVQPLVQHLEGEQEDGRPDQQLGQVADDGATEHHDADAHRAGRQQQPAAAGAKLAEHDG
ncbi:hypothetical protein D3C83_45860 [compost metagenome]